MPDEQLIPVDPGPPEVQEEPMIPVDPGLPGPPTLPPPIAQKRTSMTSFALGKPYDVVQQSIESGGEENLRVQAASEIDANNKKKVNDIIFETATKRGAPLTTDEINVIQDQVTKAQEFTHPRSVFEAQFSNKYFGALYNDTKEQGSWYSDFIRKDPDAEEHATHLGKDYLATRKLIDTLRENAEAALESQGYISRGADIAKNLVTFGLYGEYKQRGNIPGTDLLTLLGTSKEQQRINLFRMPLAQRTEVLTKIADQMTRDNPAQAVEFLDGMAGNFDKDMENFMSAITLSTTPGLATSAKVLGRGGFAAARLAKNPEEAGKLLKATTDVIRGAESTQPIKVAQNIAAGDLKEASIQKSTADLVSNLSGKGDPTVQLVDNLHNILRERAEHIRANPGQGPGAQELSNRIARATEETGDVINQIANFQRGERVPAAVATESAIRLQADVVKDSYKGIDSRVVGIDLFRHSLTNTKYWQLQIGHADGTLFGSAEKAAAAAQLEGIGLKGRADGARQLELQRLIRQTEFDLDNARKVKALSKRSGVTAENMRDRLGISGMTKRPDFDKNLKKLEDSYAAYTKELSDLRARPGATVEQQGTKFYISKFEPFRETDPSTRSLLLTTPSSQTPQGYYKSLMAWLRTGEETASRDNMAQAKIAVYGSNKLLELAKAELEPYRKLTKWTFPLSTRREQAQRVSDTLKAGRTEGLYNTPAELQDHYLRHYGVLPSDRETEAYFAATRYGQLQDILTSVDMYTNEARLGTKMHSIQTTDKLGNPTSSGFFKGISRNELPTKGEGVLYIPEGLGSEKIYTASGIGKLKDLKDLIKQGRMKVIEVVYPNDSPLKNFGTVAGDNHIKYVVTPSVEEGPLTLTKVDRKGGGLWDQDYSDYLKQAKMVFDQASKTWRYKGDTTLMPFNLRTLGNDVGKLINEVREHLNAGREGSARTAASKLPIEWAELKGWFEPRTLPDGKVVPPKLSLDEPIRLVPRNKLIVNMDEELRNRHGTKFRDDTKGNLIHQNLIKLGEHDPYEMYTVVDKGSRKNPLYSYEPAEYIDPIPSMNRSMRRIIDSIYMDDYKLFAVEHWIQEAKRLNAIDATDKQLANAPMHYFFNGKWNQGTPIDVQYRLEDMRTKAKQIWGTPSKTDTLLHSVSQQMSDTIYSNFGPKILTPAWKLGEAGIDAASKIKSLTYHAAIGLFALPQFIVQNMTWASIAGIEGIGHASSGAAATLFHQWLRAAPGTVDLLDKFMTRIPLPTIEGAIRGKGALVRWRPGEFKEARELLDRTGFDIVGSEHSLLDNPYSTKVISTGRDQILDWGSIPFREGDKNVRIGAWYTTYRKFRDEHPTGALSQSDVAEILDRADTLAGSMSNASKSALQRGPLSFATQFLGYNLRMAELMTGKRLTAVEKARLFTTYWGLYGVSAAGLAGVPLGDYLRKKAIDYGYTHDEGAISTWLMEGIPAAATQMITGKLYGIGQRYGSVGFDPIRELLSGDKPMWQLATGASGTFVSNVLESTNGFRKSMMSLARDDDTYFPLKTTDFVEPLKTIASVNSALRYAAALRSTDWLNKKGQKIDTDVSPLNALIMTLSGVQEQKVYDRQAQFALQDDRKNELADVEKVVSADLRRYAQAIADKDWEQATDYGKRVRAMLIAYGYPTSKFSSLMARAEKENQTLISRGNYDMYLNQRTMDPRLFKQRQEQFIRLQQQKGQPQ